LGSKNPWKRGGVKGKRGSVVFESTGGVWGGPKSNYLERYKTKRKKEYRGVVVP